MKTPFVSNENTRQNNFDIAMPLMPATPDACYFGGDH